jgi:predicted ATPase
MRVARDGVEIALRPAQRRLLTILALAPRGTLDTERLIDRMWSEEPPRTARAALQTHVSAIRRALGNGAVVSDGDGYRLDIVIDASTYLSLAQEAREAASDSEWDRCLKAIGSAEALWRDLPYAEVRYDDFAQPAIANLEEARQGLLEMRARARLALGLYDEAIPELEALVAEHPLQERFWEHLMQARYRNGRHAEALLAYQEASGHLAEIGAEPGEDLRRLAERVRRHDETLKAPRTNLPLSLSAFVGRAEQVLAVTACTQDNRLVTLTGAGGSGKTRLAIEVARGLTASFVDGVWFADLAATHDQGQVASEMARAVGLQPRSEDVLRDLADATRLSEMLVVLDNCEHLLESVASAAQRLLESAPDLKILATSREALRVPGELVYEVPAMSFPAELVTDLDAARGFEAVRLFEQRANHSDRSFQLRRDNLAAVASICRRLDGMPLAIELAAARTRTLSVQHIAERLDNRLGLLTAGATTAPPRQQTLRATIDWSYRLLDETQRTVLDRLSVFRGGFPLDAAERVVSGDGITPDQVAGVLADLVDKSLVGTRRLDGEVRYQLLETVRQYAGARLNVGGTSEVVARRHLLWCSALTGDLWERALGVGQAGLATMLDRESDNLHAGLEFARTHDEARAGVQLAQAVGWRWYLIGHLGAAAAALRTALRGTTGGPAACLLRALLARCLAYSEDIAGARREAEAAHDLIASLDAPLTRVWVAQTLQLVIFMSVDADPEDMLALAEEAAEIAIPGGGAHAELLARQALADAYCINGKTGEGLEQQRVALDLAARTGDPTTIHQIFGQSIYNFMLDPAARPSEPQRVVDRWLSLAPLDAEAWASVATDWLPWVYLQAGDFDRAEEAAKAMSGRNLEGYNRTIHLIVRATVAWMRGRLDESWSEIGTLSASPLNPRWAHTQYPLVAEVAADLGHVDVVRRVADSFLAMELHSTREATKLGVLGPLVRAEVDAALQGGEDDHRRRAHAALEVMRRILRGHPPRIDSWWSIMTHTQNLTFATAELSRLTATSAALWADAFAAADYAYYRIYARWRLGEALLEAGDARRGSDEIRTAHADALRVGAGLLTGRIVSTARRHDVGIALRG